MVININTEERKFFRQVLEVVKSFPPLVNLTSRELDILGELLYFDNKYRGIPEELRNKIIFDYDTKMQIASYLSISEYVLNNAFTSLRKKNIIKTRSLSIPPIRPENFSIVFNFNITDSK